MTKARKCIHRSDDEWQTILNRFQHSSLTVKSFCEAERLALSTFQLKRRKLSNGPLVLPSDEQQLFVAIADPVEDQEQTRPLTDGTWDVELQLGDDMVLRLRRPC